MDIDNVSRLPDMENWIDPNGELIYAATWGGGRLHAFYNPNDDTIHFYDNEFYHYVLKWKDYYLGGWATPWLLWYRNNYKNHG